jgi:hypothetical protein
MEGTLDGGRGVSLSVIQRCGITFAPCADVEMLLAMHGIKAVCRDYGCRADRSPDFIIITKKKTIPKF